MTALLDVDAFKVRTVMPPADVEFVQANHPGFLEARLAVHTSILHARLRKRYAVPFAEPVPEIVLGWLVALTTVDAYRKRGWSPADAQSADILQDRADALEQLTEAANSETGLFDLPLREDSTATGITKAAPFGYSEPDAYEWTDVQAEELRGR